MSQPGTGKARCGLDRPTSAGKPPKPPRSTGTASYEDLIVAQYLDGIKKEPPYAKPGDKQTPSPYLQKLPHTNIVPTPGMVNGAQQGDRSRPVSASAAGRSRSTGKPKIDAKFIADPSLWDPATPRDAKDKSMRRRPLSAPAAKYRCHRRRPVSAYTSPCGRKSKPLYRQISRPVVATAFKNGTRDVYARIAVPSIKMLLEMCTTKLQLTSAARRVFLDDGLEVWHVEDIPRDSEIYISQGEDFKNPYKTAKDNNKLKASASWTMNGVVFQNEPKKRKKKCMLSKRFRELNFGAGKTRRVLVFRNGKGVEPIEVVANLDNYDEFLIPCTAKLNLTSHAKILFDWEGNEIFDLHDIPVLDKCLQTWTTPVLGPVWVSLGEGFSPSGVQIFLLDIIRECRDRVKQSEHYKSQLELTKGGDEERAKITITAILSMSRTEVDETLNIVEKDIEDHNSAISRMKSQLKKIKEGAGEEQFEGHEYRMKHIKKFETNDRIVGTAGIKLKVYDNGTDDQEHVMYFNMRDLTKGMKAMTADEKKKMMMERLLDQLSMKKSGGSGPIAKKIFDRYGNEITSISDLETDQCVWVSYGEAFKSPYTYVLQVMFDKAAGVNMYNEKQTAYREQLVDEDVKDVTSSDFDACIGLPIEYECKEIDDSTNPVEREHIKDVLNVSEISPNSHFLKNKDNSKFLLYPELVIDVKRNKNSKDMWPGETQTWVISKTGYIYTMAMSQLVLSVTEIEVTIPLKTPKATEVEGFLVTLQKKMVGNPNQRWGFSTDGFIYCLGQPELVLTHLGPLFGDEENQITSENGPKGHRAYVAVCEKVDGKDGAQQRWAIKQERLDNLGQWKHTQGTDQEWKKRAYSWPVTEEGNWNEDFDWPMEGFLIPGVPPIRKVQKDYGGHIPLRLMVVKNGEKQTNMVMPVVGPNLTNMMKDLNKTAQNGKRHMGHSPVQKRGQSKVKHDHSKCEGEDKGDSVANDTHLHCEEMTLPQLEMLLFLERCTGLLDLPFAARRLFDETGREHVTLAELQRDQLVFVSCGEPFNDPSLSKKEQQRRFLLANLAGDVAQIRQFVALRDPQDFVLEVEGALVPNARLIVNQCYLPPESHDDQVSGDEDEQTENDDQGTHPSMDEILETTSDTHSKTSSNSTAHERAHMRSENRLEKMKWPWERIANEELTDTFEEHPVSPTGKMTESQRKRSRSRSPVKSPRTPGIHLQMFVFNNGFIQSANKDDLVLGVAEQEGRVMEVTLMKKRADNIYQQWVMQENGIIRSKHNPQLVLSVSMPSNLRKEDTAMPLSYVGAGVSLQPKKIHQFGQANQRWRYDPETKVISAFHTDYVDKEVTAANKANVCTYAVTQEELDQPGYTTVIPAEDNKSQRIFLCTSCARAMRGRHKLEKIPHAVDFSCAMGRAKDYGMKQIGSFQCLNGKVDLSTFEAKNTLNEWEETLDMLRQETSVRVIARHISATRTVTTVKIYAYRNGEGRLKPGELIVGSSIVGLLEQCTYRLQMSSAARRLFTADGTMILDMDDLINWAVLHYMSGMKQMHKKKVRQEPDGQQAAEDQADSVVGSQQESQTGSQQTTGSNVSGPTEVNKLFDKKESDKEEESKPGEPVRERRPSLDRRSSIDKTEPPPLEVILRYPVEIWASTADVFVKPEDVEVKYLEQLQQREERSAVTFELEKEKHVLRQMQGRRLEEMSPGEYRSTRSPTQPVVIENSWQEPTVQEQETHDKVHLLETHLAEVKASQLENPKTRECNTSSTRRLYQQPAMKRVLIFPNGESMDRACYVWGESIHQLLDNASQRLNLRKPAKVLFTLDGIQIKQFDEIERDQLMCVSYGRPFVRPKDSHQTIEVKANWSRARRQHGPHATELTVQRQKNAAVDVDPFGPPILAITDGQENKTKKPPLPRDYHSTR